MKTLEQQPPKISKRIRAQCPAVVCNIGFVIVSAFFKLLPVGCLLVLSTVDFSTSLFIDIY